MSRRGSAIDPKDPIDNESGNAGQYPYDYDTAGSAQLPPLHLTKTKSNRSRSSSLINAVLGRKEVHEGSDDNNNNNNGNNNIGNDEGLGDRRFTITEHPTEEDEDKQIMPEQESQESQDNQVPEEESSTSTSEPASTEKQGTEGTDTGDTPVIGKKEKSKRKKATIFKVIKMMVEVYIMIFCLFILILSVYWGSLYNRASYYHKISYLVVLAESNSTSTPPPLFSETLRSILTSDEMKKYGTFHIHNLTDFSEIAQSHNNNTIREEIIREVHHQNYWGGIYVPENITLDYFASLSGTNTSAFNSSIELIYETGRNPTGVSGYVVGIVENIEKLFVAQGAKYIVEPLISELNSTQVTNLLSDHSSLLSDLWWNYYDNRPNPGAITIAVVQIGLVYILVLSFHQFLFASPTHQIIAKEIHAKDYLLYHFVTSHLAYLFLSLVYCLMTLAFRVPVFNTFGHSGFLVEWAILFLTMSALGGTHENVAVQVFARYKPLIGFWVVGFLAINVSVIFSPMVVMNNFYRYGYALPLHQGNELLKVVFYDTYKGHMGRNFGLLIAWEVMVNAILPFNLKNVRNYLRAQDEKALKALENDKNSKK